MAGASTAAYPTTIKVPGTSTALSNEATTSLVADTQFQITNTAHRILDPAVAVVVQVSPDNSTWSSPAQSYTVDYMFGIITFPSSLGSPGAFCRVQTGNYYPLQLLGYASDFTHTVTRTIVDTTAFTTAGNRTKTPTLHDASVSCSTFQQLNLNPVTGAQSITTLRDNGTPLIVEINPAALAPANGNYWRGWMLIESTEEKGEVAGVYTGSIKLNSAPVTVATSALNSTIQTLFGWGQ